MVRGASSEAERKIVSILKVLSESSEDLNRVGIVLLGGLNPVAAAVEAGIEVKSIAESGLIDYQQLKSFWQL